MTFLEITHLYCKASGLPVGADGSRHHLVPRAAGRTPQKDPAFIHVCKHCGLTVTQIRENVERVGLECGGKPGDFLHHTDGTHRASALSAKGGMLERFERESAAHRGDRVP